MDWGLPQRCLKSSSYLWTGGVRSDMLARLAIDDP